MSAVRCIGCMLLAAMGLTGGVSVGAQPSEQFVVTLGAHELPGLSGDRLAFDWIRGLGRGAVYGGFERRRAGSTDWRLLELGGGWTLSNGLNLSGVFETDRNPSDGGRYERLQAALAFRIGEKWSVTGDETVLQIDPVDGYVASVSATRVWGNAITTSLRLSKSHGGNLDDNSTSARLRYRDRPPYFMAGFVAGSSNNRLLLDVPKQQATETRFRQGFIGLSAPIGGTMTTLSLEAAKIGELRRIGITLSVAFGARRRE